MYTYPISIIIIKKKGANNQWNISKILLAFDKVRFVRALRIHFPLVKQLRNTQIF